MWTDNETTVDLLGFETHTSLIKSVILDNKLLPTTIGLYGDWGGGKTSVLKMLEKALDPNTYDKDSEDYDKLENVACLYFNGWLFEGYDDAKSALLSSILVELGSHKRFGPKIKDRALKLIKSVNWMRVARLGFKEVALPAILATATGGASLLPSVIAQLGGIFTKKEKSEDDDEDLDWDELFGDKSTEETSLEVKKFREEFAKLLDDSDIKTLVVLIDDLDRCSPTRIIENLEAIKLFLNINNTAFVIGADPRIVKHAVKTVYGDINTAGEGGGYTDIVTEYLEKVIQIPYYLPWLSPIEVESYISMLFCQQFLPESKFDDLCAYFNNYRKDNHYSVFGYGVIKEHLEQVPLELANSLLFTAEASSLLTEGLKGNPRQVKRFLNAYMLRKKLAKVTGLKTIDDSVLIKLMLLEYIQPIQYKELYEWQAQQNGVSHELISIQHALENDLGADVISATGISDKWASLKIKKWILMNPKLADVDLRDYFWISRDKLASTFSGISMISPLVRKLFEEIILADAVMVDKMASDISLLNETEVNNFLNLLSKQIKKHPEDVKAFEALVILSQKQISGSAKSLLDVLTGVDATLIPASIGLRLKNIMRTDYNLWTTLKPAVEQIARTDSRVGRALKLK